MINQGKPYEYWATKNSDDIIDELMAKIEHYDDYLLSSGVMNILRDSYNTFYGDSKIRDVGNSSELKAFRINHYASLIRSLISMVTNQRIVWQSIASNTDTESQAAAILASGLLDFYMKNNRLDRVFKNAALQAAFLKESWVATTWKTTKGLMIAVDPSTQSPIHEGDLQFDIFGLNDVIRDYTRTDNDFDWLITRDFTNTYDLIAQFPEFQDKILGLTIDKLKMDRIRVKPLIQQEESDLIPLYTFYFKQTASLPNGRMIQFVEDQVLTDSPLPYPRIPLTRIAAEDTFEDVFGHSPMHDVLAIQKGIDTLASILLTNNSAFGVQNIKSPKGSGISVTQIHGGLNLLEYDKNIGGPEPLQLTASAPETYKFMDTLIQQSQLLSGVNAAVRGDTPPGMSGAAMALLSQQAIQFSSGLQQSYIALAEDTGTLAVQILQQYANTKRIAVLAGKHNRPLLKEWSKQDLNGVSRVTIESGSALSKTAAGRMQIADSLLKIPNMVQTPDQYIAVLETGRLEPIYENTSRQLMLIRAENEKLGDGQQVRALITDSHEEHILEHASVLSSPEVRDNPNSPIIINTTSHIMDHLNMVRTCDPGLMAILKQQPLPPPAQQAPQQAPQQQNQPSGNLNVISKVENAQNPIETKAGNVNGPSMPRDLIHGGKFDPNNPLKQ